MNRRGFSLIEMLAATVLAAVLMTGVLYMLAGVARDRRTVGALNAAPPSRGDRGPDRLGPGQCPGDLGDGRRQFDGLGGRRRIDPVTLRPNGRLVRVTYCLASEGSTQNLWRTQEYLDDPVHSGTWRELVAADATDFSVRPGTSDEQVPRHIRLRLATRSQTIDQTLWIK